ncbi:hypothetical protein CISIN_1g040441mg [Citrus sinensis]|uniref:BHLH domain-containing protein n=1 Tax=Citrus sinensis TaxID=2711 RepID=A0A067G8X8_CITSI|nr:hypothetical protein CISIN_1g040441mg [Citrus sinensis]
MFVEVKKKNNPECIFNKLRRREAARKLGLCRRNHVKACELAMKIHGQNMKQSCRARNNGIERRIKTLEKLVPSDKSIGLEALFGETADYIKRLQMKVKFMQIMVKLLSPPDE